MPSVGCLCAACKHPLEDHLPSSARLPAEVPAGKVAVVNGRCIGPNGRALQKMCWVALAEPMTPAEYRRRLAEGTVRLERCPACHGRLVTHGRFHRTLLGPGGQPERIELLRGRCPNRECPVCTVTHYPLFMTPYHVVPTAEREATVRARAEGASWLNLKATVALSTARRWYRDVAARADEVLIGLTAAQHRLDPSAPALPRPANTLAKKLQAMFWVCDAVRALLAASGGWAVPALAVARLFQPPGPTPLPVWT